MKTRNTVGLCVLSLCAAASHAAAGDTLAIRAGRVLVGDGTQRDGGWIVIRAGRIEALAQGEAPAGATRFEFAGAVACPGFIDPVTQLGARDQLEEPARALTPELDAAEGLELRHRDFRRAARGGITTVGLVPGAGNVVGGKIAAARCAGARGVAEIVGTGPVRLSLSPQTLQREREPTSRMGAITLLREFLSGDAGRSSSMLLFDAVSADEIRLAVSLVGAAQRELTLLNPLELDALDHVAGRCRAAVVGPLTLQHPRRAAHVVGKLNERGVPLAFTGGGDPAALRLTAALAAREGVPADRALAGLTSVPAAVLGVAADCGTLETGKRADLLLFGGDPLDVSSPLLLVLVGGVPVDELLARSEDLR